MNIFLLTHSPSPYQVELFNEIASAKSVGLRVGYLLSSDPARSWKQLEIRHDAMILDDKRDGLKISTTLIKRSEVAVFNYYFTPGARQLISDRAASGGPWCFWGERPGFHKPEWVGRLIRRWKLAWLHMTKVPIWGIGQFAVERYQKEFGEQRAYCNLPYFSDLDRFQKVTPVRKESERVFLFSGSLIHRKGVDLLARAFVRLARQMPNVRLKLMGEGQFRGTLERTLHPVKDRVEFLGFKEWSELPACYASADVLCVPSRYDGWGLVVPEGLAAGLPVIGTEQMGAAVEFIETGRNGWLIPAGDEDALFAALQQAALMPASDLARLSQNARESVSEHSLRHGAERFVRAAQDVYQNWGTQD